MTCNFQEGGGQVLAFYQSRDSNLRTADAGTPCLFCTLLLSLSSQYTGRQVVHHQQVSTMTEHLTDTGPSLRVCTDAKR